MVSVVQQFGAQPGNLPIAARHVVPTRRLKNSSVLTSQDGRITVNPGWKKI